MQFSFWPRSNQTWEDTLALAKHAELSGWDGIWYADHFMPNSDDLDESCHEVWSVIAAWAATVPRIRIGPMVACNTYRHPAVHANIAATIDHISGGRLVLGMGAGWQENEHAFYGIELPPMGARLKRFEEACRIIRSLLDNERTTVDGDFYQVIDAPMEPKPVQTKLPLLIGGAGEKVTLRIVAELADEWNVWGDVPTLAHKIGVLERHCAKLGRDPRSIRRTAAVLLHISEDRAANENFRANAPRPCMAGSASELRDTVAAYAAAGVDEIIVSDALMEDMDDKRRIMDCFIEDVASA